VTTYATADAAYTRVDQLRRAGCWPGVRHTPDGWQLTYDPGNTEAAMT
jgi:uncharacterized protein YbdZ (MbtH family)